MCHHPDYGCEHHFHLAPYHSWHPHRSCCRGPGYAPRCFPSKEEIVEDLEEYLKQLRGEVKGVEERLVELRKEG